MKALTTLYVVLSIGVLCPNWMVGQKDLDIRFEGVSHSDIDQKCYQLQIKAIQNSSQLLGSQSYRIFYNAEEGRFLRSATTNLIGEQYGLKIVQSIYNSDASGFGNLNFDSSLGFINITITDSGNRDDMVSLIQDKWLSTAQICFEKNMDKSNLNLVWAREGLTDGYATAYTGVAIVDELNLPANAELNYIDNITEDLNTANNNVVSNKE